MTKRSKRPTAFAVCIDHTGYPASLEAGKLYEVVPDAVAKKHGLIRVINESGEDYGYSVERFFILAVPHTLEKALKGISATRQPKLSLKPTSGPRVSKQKRPGTPRRSPLSV